MGRMTKRNSLKPAFTTVSTSLPSGEKRAKIGLPSSAPATRTALPLAGSKVKKPSSRGTSSLPSRTSSSMGKQPARSSSGSRARKRNRGVAIFSSRSGGSLGGGLVGVEQEHDERLLHLA